MPKCLLAGIFFTSFSNFSIFFATIIIHLGKPFNATTAWVHTTSFQLGWKSTKPYYRDCAVPYVRHFYTGYGIFHCDLMKYDLKLHWITMEYAVSRMKISHVRACTIPVLLLLCNWTPEQHRHWRSIFDLIQNCKKKWNK